MKTPRSFRKRVGPTLRCVGGARGKCVPVNLKEASFCLLEYALSAVDEGRFFLFFSFPRPPCRYWKALPIVSKFNNRAIIWLAHAGQANNFTVEMEYRGGVCERRPPEQTSTWKTHQWHCL